ncbi:MAG TPA: HRDC domain-containing protein [Gemmatimonadaceae bacterium]|nr:HRDC domain-containing protein [Gemmatimonadaceae bacterium]
MAEHTPIFLDRPDVTARQLGHVTSVKEIAVDTEGASFHRFVDRVYLLQFSTKDRTVIVDPLAVPAPTLAPLGAVLESPSVETVFHDADYDLRLLQRDYGWHVRNIFDTRIAAQLLGLKAFGLAALLDRYFHVTLDKKHQRADWSMRPLPSDMLDYAAQDTMYLLQLRDRMRDELEMKGRLEWAREEFVRLEGTKWSEDDPSLAFLRVKGARDLSRRELAILRELVPWRDAVARETDRATFRVIGNEQLLAIAREQPRTREALSRIRGVGRGLFENRAGEILEAVRRGQDVLEADLPRFPRSPRWDRDSQFDARVTALKTVRDDLSQRLDIDPGVLASRERLEAVARRKPVTREELSEIPELRRWQVELLGDGFVRALKQLSA